MSERIWHKGPPPHVGWWNASTSRGERIWRWWDGRCWSAYVLSSVSAEHAAHVASMPVFVGRHTTPVEWTDYWPENARVPRVDPRKPAQRPATLVRDVMSSVEWQLTFRPDYPEAVLGHLAPPAPPQPWVRPHYDDKRFPLSPSYGVWEYRFHTMLEEIDEAPEAEREAVADDVLTFVHTQPAAFRYLFMHVLARSSHKHVLAVCTENRKGRRLLAEGVRHIAFFKTLPEKLS